MAEETGPNLTQFTYLGRQFIKFGSLTLVFLIVGRMFFSAFITFWKATHPEPPPPPTVGFGILPALRFEEKEINRPVSYRLETATGSLPQFDDRAKVFLMPPSSLSLLSDGRAREMAADLDFVFEPDILTSRIYRWTRSNPLESVLDVDIQSTNFKLKTDYLSRPGLLSNNQLPDNFEAVSRVKSILSTTGTLGDDMATASGEVVYKKNIGGELGDALSFSDADFLEVNINRTPIDSKFRMMTPEGYKAVVNAVVIGALPSKNSVVYIENKYHPVDYSEVHTYPLRPTSAAWKIVQNGEAFIVDPGETEQVVIRRVYLAYYDDFVEQEYLQPIYVFEGDDDFMAYVHAIDPMYVQK